MKGTLIRLTLRDIQKILNLRTLLVWGTLSALGVFFFFATSGRRMLLQNNEVEFMALFLSQIIFGAWAVLSVYFDLVSSDRQHNVLDCILCAGISKPMVFYGKMAAMVLVSLALSFAYLLPVTIGIIVVSGNIGFSVVLFQYLLPLWGYIMVYAALGIVISILARSTKTALIVSLASGLILMPRFFMIIIEMLGAILGWSAATKDAISMVAPGVMMEALSRYSATVEYIKTTVVFTSGIAIFLIIAFIVFCKQDELNYGE